LDAARRFVRDRHPQCRWGNSSALSPTLQPCRPPDSHIRGPPIPLENQLVATTRNPVATNLTPKEGVPVSFVGGGAHPALDLGGQDLAYRPAAEGGHEVLVEVGPVRGQGGRSRPAWTHTVSTYSAKVTWPRE
jgi:hypothetical protein